MSYFISLISEEGFFLKTLFILLKYNMFAQVFLTLNSFTEKLEQRSKLLQKNH